MERLINNKKNTKMIAHRGLSYFETENTAASFIAACNRTYFGSECDIHPTKDGKLVVIHDSDMMRVAGTSLIIEENNYQDIENITLLTRDKTTSYPYQKVPTFEEYIYIHKKYQKKCIIEIKGTFSSEMLNKTLQIVKEYDYLDNVIFISFIASNLIYLRSKEPNIPMQLLVGEVGANTLDLCKTYHFGLDINHYNLTKEIIDIYHQNNLEVNAWTVDDIEIAKKLIDEGIDYITTNVLE